MALKVLGSGLTFGATAALRARYAAVRLVWKGWAAEVHEKPPPLEAQPHLRTKKAGDRQYP